MDEYLKQLYFSVGLKCGKENTCKDNGKPKVNYQTEDNAILFAEVLSIKYDKEMNAYPCIFCNGWHIGRKKSMEQLLEISNNVKIKKWEL